MKHLTKHEIMKVRSARIWSTFYWLLCMGACWLGVFAVTGSVLRSLMFIVAVLLIIISSSQYNAILDRIKLITMSPQMQQFEQWINPGIATAVAGEDLKTGDLVYIGKDGTMKKINPEKPE